MSLQLRRKETVLTQLLQYFVGGSIGARPDRRDPEIGAGGWLIRKVHAGQVLDSPFPGLAVESRSIVLLAPFERRIDKDFQVTLFADDFRPPGGGHTRSERRRRR